MQLPPTILSLNNNKGKKHDHVSAKLTGKKTTAPKVKTDSKNKSNAPEPPPADTPRDEDHNGNSADESDEEGDAIMNDDGDGPSLIDGTEAATSASRERNPPIIKKLCRGTLVPPRTLETTLFDRLEKMYGPGIKRLLNVQYRWGDRLLELVSY
jgi:DNA polymerase alpha-associated DNA helicase A